MTTAARSQFLQLLRSGETRLRDDFARLSDRARTYLLSVVDDATGKVPLSEQKKVEQQVGTMLLYYFLAQGATAYTLTANGTLIPTSPYMRLLWSQVSEATRTAVNEQAAQLRTSLAGSEDVMKKLANATVSPFAADSGMDGNLFTGYVAPYNVLWSDHRPLQDRTLLCAAETRRKVLLLLSMLLSEGRSAKEIADTLDQFMTDKLKGSNKPYGTTSLFDSSRLLLSETNYAYNHAGLISAALDPFVTEVDWVLSPSHRGQDICDEMASGSPYKPESVPPFPQHASCMCHLSFRRNNRRVATAEALRRDPARMNLLLRGGQ